MDRIKYLTGKCVGKDVLDLGCGNGTLSKCIQGVCKSYVGCDLIHGTDFRKAKGKYDVVVAGELIEHLTDYGSLFQVAYKCLFGFRNVKVFFVHGEDVVGWKSKIIWLLACFKNNWRITLIGEGVK